MPADEPIVRNLFLCSPVLAVRLVTGSDVFLQMQFLALGSTKKGNTNSFQTMADANSSLTMSNLTMELLLMVMERVS
jgi:hypothetical protein